MTTRKSPAASTAVLSFDYDDEAASNLSYATLWKRHVEALKKEWRDDILDLAVLDDQGEYVLACTRAGHLHVWRLHPSSPSSSHSQTRLPVYSQVLCDGRALHKILVPCRANHDYSTILVGGQGGIYELEWNKDRQQQSSQDQFRIMRQHAPHPCPGAANTWKASMASTTTGLTTVFDMALDQKHLYAVCNDAFGCYKWDRSTGALLATYNRAQQRAITVLAHDTDDTTTSATSIVVTGGQDGVLYIFNGETDQLLQRISVSTSTAGGGGCITSILCKENNWLVVAANVTSAAAAVGGGKARALPRGGMIATYHVDFTEKLGSDCLVVSGSSNNTAATEIISLVTSTETREIPQRLLFFRGTTLISVANESYTSHWNPFTLERLEHLTCSSKSGYALCEVTVSKAAGETNLLAAGEGGVVDVFENHATQLSLRYFLQKDPVALEHF